MKKYFFLASILAFMSCSSDSSSSSDNGEGTQPPVKENEVGRLLFTENSLNGYTVSLNIFDPKDAKITNVAKFDEREYSMGYEFTVDDKTKMLYSITSYNDKFLSYDYDKRKEVSYVEVSPKNLLREPYPGIFISDNRVVYFDNGKGTASEIGFLSINPKSGHIKLENESKELPKYYKNGGCGYAFLDYKNKNELVALLNRYDFNSLEGNVMTIVRLNVNNFKEFDSNTKDKTIVLKPYSEGEGKVVGFAQDRNGNFYYAFNKENNPSTSIVTIVNPKDGSLTKVFETGGIYDMFYDELSHSLFLIGEDDNQRHSTMFKQYDLTKKVMVKQVPFETIGKLNELRVIK